MRGAVAGQNFHSAGCERVAHAVRGKVAAGHAETARGKMNGQAGHADAGDAHEMDTARTTGQEPPDFGDLSAPGFEITQRGHTLRSPP